MKRIQARRKALSSSIDSHFAETKKALKIYKEIREEEHCRLILNSGQQIIVQKINRMLELFGKGVKEYRISIL